MRTVKSKLAFLAVLIALVPATARSATWRTADSTGLMSPIGEYVHVGLGISDFTDSALKDAYDMGLTWEARLGIGSRSFIGAEVAYVGAKRSAAVGNADIMAHGAEAALRLQLPYAMDSMLLEPFVLAGIGWSHLTVDNVPAGLDDTDDIGVVPLGVGVMVGFGRFLIDGRFVYRTTFSEDLGDGDLKSWSLVGAIGYEF